MTIPTIPTGDPHDFDFLFGTWNVANRRLKERGVGSDEWEEFPATERCEPHMGGLVNVEEMVFPTLGRSGMAIRAFDLANRRWSIHWIDSRGATLCPPVHGGFDGDRGTFYGEDLDDGRPVEVQFRWTRLGPDTARWEQAFSFDGGEWEWNWVMEFTRAAG